MFSITDDDKSVRAVSPTRHRIQDPVCHLGDPRQGGRGDASQQVQDASPGPEAVLLEHGSTSPGCWTEDYLGVG